MEGFGGGLMVGVGWDEGLGRWSGLLEVEFIG